jgi:hypothetical protein
MIILDTNVLSEIMRVNPAPPVAEWVVGQLRSELFTTAITEAEIFFGIQLLPLGKRRDSLLLAAEAILTDDFAGRILPFDSAAPPEPIPSLQLNGAPRAGRSAISTHKSRP